MNTRSDTGFLEKIVNKFTDIIKDFMKRNTISDEDVRDYKRSNLHSWLQYAMIKAGECVRLLAVPEIKLYFTKPLNPQDYGLVNKKMKRHFKRVDVGFHDSNKKLLGISEIFTMDEAHGCLSTLELVKVKLYWLTPRDTLIYAVQNSKQRLEFVIIVVALSKSAKYIAWKTGISKIDSELQKDKNYYRVFKDRWIEFKNELERYVNCSLVIISEDSIEII